MVSWGDGEDSSTNMSSDNSMSTTVDEEWCGLADDLEEPVLCRCGFVAVKRVAWGGYKTGRRFYACEGQDGEKCDFVQWVDPVWPDPMVNAINKLWDMFEQTKQGRINDALDNIEKGWEAKDKIKELTLELSKSQDDFAKVVAEKQTILANKAIAEQGLMEAMAELHEKKRIDVTTVKMHKYLLIKTEKERDECKEEKRKLECIISDLLKEKEGYSIKFQKIRQLAEM